jgi:hypothetical protein
MRTVKFVIASTLLCASLAHAATACDPEVVKSERASMQGFGTWRDGKQGADFRWAALFDDIAPGARVALMKQVAAWDHCANAKPREIDFYLRGKLIARVLGDGRYLPVDNAFVDGPQIKFWFKFNGK